MEFKTLGDTLAELKAMSMLNAKCCMLNMLGDTVCEVRIDTLFDTFNKQG